MRCAREAASPAPLTLARRRRCNNVHEAHGGVTTAGIGVRGSVKKIVH